MCKYKQAVRPLLCELVETVKQQSVPFDAKRLLDRLAEVESDIRALPASGKERIVQSRYLAAIQDARCGVKTILTARPDNIHKIRIGLIEVRSATDRLNKLMNDEFLIPFEW